MKKFVLKLKQGSVECTRIIPAKDERQAVNRINENETLISVTPYQGKSEVQMRTELEVRSELMRLSCYYKGNLHKGIG